MAKPTTHVLMLIDESGSMTPLADDVRGGFNTYLDGLADDDARYRVTVAKFSSDYTLMCTATKIKDTPRLTSDNYRPQMLTALLDGIGKIITDFETVNRQLADGDRVILFISTDGHENQSREYDLATVQKMIADRQATGVWSAVFVGAGPDTWQQAARLGIREGSTVSMANTSEGYASTYMGLSKTTRLFSAGASADESVAASGLTVGGQE